MFGQSVLDAPNEPAPVEREAIPENKRDFPIHYLLRTHRYDAVLDLLPVAAEFDEPDREDAPPPPQLYSAGAAASRTAGALRPRAAVGGTLVRPDGQRPDASPRRPAFHALANQIAHS